MNYDFHFSFGKGTTTPHTARRIPRRNGLLWRDYDPAKTSQSYDPRAAENPSRPFGVSITNRSAE